MLYGQGAYRYELVDDWAQLPDGDSFVDVGGLTVDAEDRVYVLNRGRSPVRVFSRDGHLLDGWGAGLFTSPHGVCIAADFSVYCTDDRDHTVRKFSRTGELLMTFGRKDQPSDTGYRREKGSHSVSTPAGPFNRPTGVAVTPEGSIFVSDGYGNSRIHKFAPDGTLIQSWGEPGSETGQLTQPHSVRLDDLGRLWVSDRENSRLQIFSQDGDFIRELSDIGGKPSDVFVDLANEQVIYAAIKSGRSPFGVSVLSLDGKRISAWGDTESPEALFWSPHAIAVDSRGDIYLGEIRHAMRSSDKGARALRKFVRRR